MQFDKRKDICYLPSAKIRRERDTDSIFEVKGIKGIGPTYSSHGHGINESEKNIIRFKVAVHSSYQGGLIIHNEPLYIKIENDVLFLSYQLKDIYEIISESKQLLNLKDDWDDAGALATDADTFIKAVTFLVVYSTYLLKNGILESPFIDVMRDGSVSIWWENSKASLLIIFKKGNAPISYFYGEEKASKVPFKYAIGNVNQVDEILALWMTKYLI